MSPFIMGGLESDGEGASKSKPASSYDMDNIKLDHCNDDESENRPLYTTELRKDLKERHVNMMTFAACIGIGLFLQSGHIIFLAGPGLAVIAYLLTGSFIWATMGCLGEMSALFPMTGGIFIFPTRFLDEGVGYAVGWMMWISWTVIIASEVLAVAQLFKFQFTPSYLKMVGYPDPSLQWTFGLNTSPLVWVSICLVIVLLPNCLPVRWYGRLEYLFGCIKMIFIVGLILMNVILNALQRVKHNRGTFWTYDEPYSFAAHNVTLGPDGTSEVLSGTSGVFLGMWTAMTTVIYSMIGFETISVTAGENKDLKSAETIKIATRKINIRIILLYSLACFCVGLNVPYTDQNLRTLVTNGVKTGDNSAFMLSLILNHVRGWPHFFNAFFIFSAATSCMNALYLSSRILHALALCQDVWPRLYLIDQLRDNLARTVGGVPYWSIFVSWLVGFLAFLAAAPSSSTILGRMATNSISSMLLVYCTLCVTYLKFYGALDQAKNGLDERIDTGTDTNAYDRDNLRYPYRSHFQRGRALWGFIGCFLILLLNGWQSFVSPFNGGDFVASYISIPIFMALVVLYHVKRQGCNPRNWAVRADCELQDPRPLVVSNKERRGILKFRDSGLTRRNVEAFGKWVWIWLK